MPRLKSTVTGVVVSVGDDVAAALDSEWVDADTADAVQVPDGEPNTAWKIDQLKAYAVEHDVDLGEAKKKDEILSALGVEVSTS
jgi:hypothetical protein